MTNNGNLIIDPNVYMRACTSAQSLHWLTINPTDGVIEICLDHHMLSMFRMCPARFREEMIRGYGPKSKFWFLEFGALLHKCLEFYYTHFRRDDFTIKMWFDFASNLWAQGEFENWKETPGYKNVGGRMGYLALLQEYYLRFSTENERLRIVGTELYFGKGHEVPILPEPLNARIPFRLYLAGKIDLIVDDGSHIAPMDHKTHGDFRGKNPNHAYEIQEGMTGYAYAINTMVNSFDLAPGARKTNMIIMNHIQVKPAKDFRERFTRHPMRYTDWDLEQYRLRQVATARDIFNMVIDSFDGIPPQYNASVCTNWFHNECQFYNVHKHKGADAQNFVLLHDFVKKPIWDAENRDNADEASVLATR